jgi:predicted Rossmann-fold nucleotide-binding protein
LIDWIKVTMLEKEQNISKKDLNLFKIVDKPKEAVEIIDKFYNKYTLKPNF